MNLDASRIIGLLAIGAFIYLMFRRGGCCGGHIQGHQHKPQPHENRGENHESADDESKERCH